MSGAVDQLLSLVDYSPDFAKVRGPIYTNSPMTGRLCGRSSSSASRVEVSLCFFAVVSRSSFRSSACRASGSRRCSTACQGQQAAEGSGEQHWLSAQDKVCSIDHEKGDSQETVTVIHT